MVITKKHRQFNFILSTLLLTFFILAGLRITETKTNNLVSLTKINLPTSSISKVSLKSNYCLGNILNYKIIVSISQRHLWACSQSKQVYDSAVVTGDENFVADATIPGTYKIYAKETNVTLTGSDQSGSWRDPVNYWMPFLNNQYGTYGLHDAPWRTLDQFGNISPNSLNASHGCIELPTPTAAWIYNWAPIGSVVQINI